jgi:hypothetical protein
LLIPSSLIYTTVIPSIARDLLIKFRRTAWFKKNTVLSKTASPETPEVNSGQVTQKGADVFSEKVFFLKPG